MKKSALLGLVFFCTSAMAMNITWQDKNRFAVGDISLTRPNDTWRVAAFPGGSQRLVSLYKFRLGKNIAIHVEDKDSLSGGSQARLKNKYWQQRLRSHLMRGYGGQGLEFYKFDLASEKTFWAEARNDQGELMLLSIHFAKPNYASRYYVLEMRLKEKDRAKYLAEFEKVSLSLETH